jgi:hypothetical protein
MSTDSKKAPKAGGGSAGAGPGKPSAPAAPADAKKTGRVQFDERGNAIWEWAIATGAFGREVSTERLQKLENPGLSLADDAPSPNTHKVKSNPQGTVKGYNPYDSGKLGKGEAPKKKDLKKLSDWLKLKKQASGNNPEDD